MNIGVIGAGAMGSLFGALLAEGGHAVTLVDVSPEIIEAINADGVNIRVKTGETRSVPVRATSKPSEAGPVDLLLVFVKCYHTDAAIRNALPMLREETTVLSLQNGWGNAPRIAEVVGEKRVMAGVTYHSATVLGPGQIQHAGQGNTFIGELTGGDTDRLRQISSAFQSAGIATTPTQMVMKEIWSKLALNVCTLPASALLRFTAGELIEHDGTKQLMEALLHETVAVANAQGIGLDYEERHEAIFGLLARAQGAKSSMLQDVENRRRTEIDVINGAIVDAGQRLEIPVPHNQAMVWLVQSLEETFVQKASA